MWKRGREFFYVRKNLNFIDNLDLVSIESCISCEFSLRLLFKLLFLIPSDKIIVYTNERWSRNKRGRNGVCKVKDRKLEYLVEKRSFDATISMGCGFARTIW